MRVNAWGRSTGGPGRGSWAPPRLPACPGRSGRGGRRAGRYGPGREHRPTRCGRSRRGTTDPSLPAGRPARPRAARGTARARKDDPARSGRPAALGGRARPGDRHLQDLQATRPPFRRARPAEGAFRPPFRDRRGSRGMDSATGRAQHPGAGEAAGGVAVAQPADPRRSGGRQGRDEGPVDSVDVCPWALREGIILHYLQTTHNESFDLPLRPLTGTAYRKGKPGARSDSHVALVAAPAQAG